VEEQITTELLPLDAERAVTFIDKGFPYTFYFARLTQDDWLKYFNGIVCTSHNEKSQEVTIIDVTTAGVAMVEEKLVRVDGYRGDFSKREGWKSKIPPKHLNAAAIWLRNVTLSKADDEGPIDPELIEVRLDAAWGIEKPGKMEGYIGLAHRFKPVSAEQKRRYYRASSESRVVGGTRDGRTIFASKHSLLLNLYDELITETGGYSFGGRPLEGQAEAISHVDAYHKVTAVSQLFTGQIEEAPEKEE
jgi:hypothetical protein